MKRRKEIMATNWTMSQATKAILAGNKEAIVDIGRRFPLTANAIAAMGNNEGALTIISALPDYITARKIESVLKDGVQESEEEVEEEVVEEKPVKKEKAAKKPAKKVEETEEVDYSEMNAMGLFKLCKKRGIKAEPKKKAAEYIKLLKAADAKLEGNEEEEDWEEEEEVKEKPAKKTKPVAKTKKAEEDDEEEEWDI